MEHSLMNGEDVGWKEEGFLLKIGQSGSYGVIPALQGGVP